MGEKDSRTGECRTSPTRLPFVNVAMGPKLAQVRLLPVSLQGCCKISASVHQKRATCHCTPPTTADRGSEEGNDMMILKNEVIQLFTMYSRIVRSGHPIRSVRSEISQKVIWRSFWLIQVRFSQIRSVQV